MNIYGGTYEISNFVRYFVVYLNEGLDIINSQKIYIA